MAAQWVDGAGARSAQVVVDVVVPDAEQVEHLLAGGLGGDHELAAAGRQAGVRADLQVADQEASPFLRTVTVSVTGVVRVVASARSLEVVSIPKAKTRAERPSSAIAPMPALICAKVWTRCCSRAVRPSRPGQGGAVGRAIGAGGDRRSGRERVVEGAVVVARHRREVGRRAGDEGLHERPGRPGRRTQRPMPAACGPGRRCGAGRPLTPRSRRSRRSRLRRSAPSRASAASGRGGRDAVRPIGAAGRPPVRGGVRAPPAGRGSGWSSRPRGPLLRVQDRRAPRRRPGVAGGAGAESGGSPATACRPVERS